MIRRKKKRLLGKYYRIISLLFMLGCIGFYGFRLIKYYQIYNPKTTHKNKGLLSIAIPKNSPIVTTGNGLYRLGGAYVYRGNVNNNYIRLGGLLFRIVKINYGTTVELVLDEPIAFLRWNDNQTTYNNSEINYYLNTIFKQLLNQELLTTTRVCLDKIDDLKQPKIKCFKKSDAIYVKLLNIRTFLNTIIDNQSYLTSEQETMWLSDTTTDSIWHTSGLNISNSPATSYYAIKPVITLDLEVKLLGGTGTRENPYRIDTAPDYALGNYVQLENDKYRIIAVDSELIKLIRTEPLAKVMTLGPQQQFNSQTKDNLLFYLNHEYFESLPYKDLIVKNKYAYGTIEEIISSNPPYVESYVGIPTLVDYLGNTENNSGAYFLATYVDNQTALTYENGIYETKANLAKKVKPVISISKKQLKFGTGTLTNPYRIEV